MNAEGNTNIKIFFSQLFAQDECKICITLDNATIEKFIKEVFDIKDEDLKDEE